MATDYSMYNASTGIESEAHSRREKLQSVDVSRVKKAWGGWGGGSGRETEI